MQVRERENEKNWLNDIYACIAYDLFACKVNLIYHFI